MSQTRALLVEAEQARVPRLAPRTYEKAQSLLAEAERELSENRYDTDLPRSLAQQANYEARHAIYLAGLIDRLREQDQSLEDLILSYEQPLADISAAADKAAQLDKGIEPVVTELVAYIEGLREQASQAERDLTDTRTRVGELEEEIRDLDERLGGVSQERVALVQRLEAEARIREQFAAIENLFTRDEARVSREGNRMIIRLVGLTFQSGQDVVRPAYRGLLEKVRQAADVFPRSQITIEGHTDSYGGDENNLALSRRRAEAVSVFLTSELACRPFASARSATGKPSRSPTTTPSKDASATAASTSSSSRSSNPPRNNQRARRSSAARIAADDRTQSCAFEPAADDFGEDGLGEIAVRLVRVEPQAAAKEIVEVDEVLDRLDEAEIEQLVV